MKDKETSRELLRSELSATLSSEHRSEPGTTLSSEHNTELSTTPSDTAPLRCRAKAGSTLLPAAGAFFLCNTAILATSTAPVQAQSLQTKSLQTQSLQTKSLQTKTVESRRVQEKAAKTTDRQDKAAQIKREKLKAVELQKARENLARLNSLNEQIAAQPTALKYSQRADALTRLTWGGELQSLWRRDAFTNIKALNAALLDLDKAIKLEPGNAHFHEQKGDVYALKGMQREAESEFSQAIALDGKNKTLYLKRGFSLFELSENKLSMADLNTFIDQDKTNAPAYSIRARIHFQEGEREAAIADISKAVALKPKSDDIIEMRGIFYYSMKKDDLALADFKSQLANNPKSWSAHKNLAEVYTAKKNWAEAEKELTLLIEKKPRTAAYRFMRATARKQLGKTKLATEDENYGKTLTGVGDEN